ncbi:hypothetical protein F4824DRAFT_197623 [Ustulina deusta]|nr:hypothetical protein F4824DRAFT_197623 [Ustulina deusta]
MATPPERLRLRGYIWFHSAQIALSADGTQKQVEVDEAAEDSNTSKAHRELHPKPSKEYHQLDISDPMKPRIHPCNNDCAHDQCPFSEKPESKEDKTSPNNNAPRGVSPPSAPQKAGSSAGSSHEDTRASPEEQVRYSLPAPTESEQGSALSERAIDSLVGHSDFDFPSSKSSSPSTRDHGSPAAKRQDSKAVRPAENGVRETQEERKGAPEKQPQARSQSRVEREQGRGSGQEGRPRDVLEQQPKEGQRKQPGFAAYGPHSSDDRGASSREERPAGPEPPSRGPSGRRRPRRPRPKTMLL